MSVLIVAENRKARFDYHVLETFEAGLSLKGTEVKAMREGKCQLKDSFVDFFNSEMFIQSMHISPHSTGGYNNHEPERKRKLLMHRQEINRLYQTVREKGLSIVPLKIYFKEGRAKVEIALVKGKKSHDKRESIKAKDVKRDLQQSARR